MKSKQGATFFAATIDDWLAYQQTMTQATKVLFDTYFPLSQPYSGLSVQELETLLASTPICPEEGQDLEKVLQNVGQKIVQHSVKVHHPACMGHLHCAPLLPSLAAEVLLTTSNQSMDSWDQSPAATLVEEQIIAWLVDLFFSSAQGDGTFTSGGTQSNLMGLLLARDQYIQNRWQWNVQQQGLPPEAHRLRILCSEHAHFTVQQSAALLGLGEQAVIPLPVDENYCLSLEKLDQKLLELREQQLEPFALFATAGTTDFGSIDPLNELAVRAKKAGLWLHVDAAYAGACALSQSYRHLLSGIEKADSLSVDFHKLFYQPISCGAFLVRQRQAFRLLQRHASYLNPIEDEQEGIPHLVNKSLQTTRRFDALKLYISLQTVGRKQFAAFIEQTIAVARATAQQIVDHPRLELLNPLPMLNALVFRYRLSAEDQALENRINATIAKRMFREGKAVLGQTEIKGKKCLKMTLLNPLTTLHITTQVLEQVVELGKRLEQEARERDEQPDHC